MHTFEKLSKFKLPDMPDTEATAADAPKQPALDLSKNIFGQHKEKEQQEKQEQKEREERSSAPSPPPPLFTFNTTTRSTWRTETADDEKCIQIVVERKGFPNGAVICDRVDPDLLFKSVPALRKHLDGRQIFLPSASCLDEETVESMVYDLVRCAKEGTPIPVPDHVMKEPVPMILMHCVLVFFEMEKEAEEFKNALWNMFSIVDMKPIDVIWIWDTFGKQDRSEPYSAPFAEEYVQMMAWRILTLDAKLELNAHIRRLIELEQEPKYFTEVMEKRFKTHGLGKDPLSRVPKESSTKPEASALSKMSKPASGDGSEQTNHSGALTEVQSGGGSENKPNPTTTPGTSQQNKTPMAPPLKLAPPQAPCQGTIFSGFNFAGAAAKVQKDSKPTSQATAKAGTKRPSSSDDNTGDQKRVMIGFGTPDSAAITPGFNFKNVGATESAAPKPTTTIPPAMSFLGLGFGGASAGKTAESLPAGGFPSTASEIGATASSQPFNLFGGSSQATTQPATPATTTTGFPFGGSAMAQSTTGAAAQSNHGLGASAGSKANPFGATQTPATPSGPPHAGGFSLFKAPASNTSKSDTSGSTFGTPSNNAVPAATSSNTGLFGFSSKNVNTFGATSNTAGTFGASATSAAGLLGTSLTTAETFGARPSTALPAAPQTPTPSAASFSTSMNTNFGSTPQPTTGSPFPNAGFGQAVGDSGAGNNTFAFQAPAGGTGTASGAAAGGMRRMAKATGAKRPRR